MGEWWDIFWERKKGLGISLAPTGLQDGVRSDSSGGPGHPEGESPEPQREPSGLQSTLGLLPRPWCVVIPPPPFLPGLFLQVTEGVF